MSYDLFFKRSTAVSADEFTAVFERREHFKVEGTQAAYQNEDTGVYFAFDLASSSEADDEADRPDHFASFNLNYYRPHYFGLEAAPVLKAVVEAFGCEIEDPQMEGLGDGPFNEEGFLRGWNKGNAFAHRAVLQADKGPKEVYCRPSHELEAIWRWNLGRSDLQRRMGKGTFVPRIFWVVVEGVLSSAVVWPDGIPELLPAVDVYFIAREQLAPRIFFMRREDACLVRRADLQPFIGAFDSASYALPVHHFNFQHPPDEFCDFVRRLRPEIKKRPKPAMDEVLTRELVEAAQKAAR